MYMRLTLLLLLLVSNQKLPTLTQPKKGISELCFFVITNVGLVVTFALLLLLAVYQEELNKLIIDPLVT